MGKQVKSYERVLAVLQAKYSAFLCADHLLTKATSETLFGEWAAPANNIHVPGNFPLFLWARFDKALTKKMQIKLLDQYKSLKPLLVYTGEPGRDSNRGPNAGCHFGVWEHYKMTPYVTLDSRPQSPEALKALNGLLKVISGDIVPIVNSFLKRVELQLYTRQQRCVISFL